jgi:hypothetical protein
MEHFFGAVILADNAQRGRKTGDGRQSSDYDWNMCYIVDLPIVVEHRADEARGGVGGRSPEVLRDGQDLDIRQRARHLGVANPRSSQRLPRRSPMFSSNSPR